MGIMLAINSNIGFWPSILSNVIGGALGIYFFIYASAWIEKKYLERKIKKGKPIKHFTKWTRFLVWFKNRFGLRGIALMSPIITIPIAVPLAMSITHDKKRIFKYFFVACLLWSAFFFILDQFFNFSLFEF